MLITKTGLPGSPPISSTATQLLDHCKQVQQQLDSLNDQRWGLFFVEARMDFHRRFCNGFIFSTSHGIDFFTNVIDSFEGRLQWDEKGCYGDNFRKFIKLHQHASTSNH